MKKYDVVVIGGGFAGIGAALAAARENAKVLIVDKGNCFGGAAAHCLVYPFVPYKTKINGVNTALSAGLFEVICDKLKEKGMPNDRDFLEEELKYIVNEMLLEAGVDILFHAYACGVDRKEDKIVSVSFATKSGVISIEADYFIDATGDAQIAYLANCPTVLGREPDRLCQPMTLCFRVGNVDVKKFLLGWKKLKLAYAEAFEKGEFINPRENILFFTSPIDNVIHFNTTRVVKHNPTSPEEVTEAEIIARRQVYEVYEFMKRHGDGMENSFLMMTAGEIGVRESRMIVGDYVLTENDCRAFKKFEDGIAACNYDIDIHNPEGSGTSHYYFPEGEYYTIPYRSLIPTGVNNMLVAGRCISSDHGAQASYRVMSTVCNIGEAAGVAIGLAVKAGSSVRDVNVKELRGILKENGAFLD